MTDGSLSKQKATVTIGYEIRDRLEGKMTDHQFVTKEEIEQAFGYSPEACREVKMLAERLLKERDAYRDVAFLFFDVGELGSIEAQTIRETIDAEARRMLEEKK